MALLLPAGKACKPDGHEPGWLAVSRSLHLSPQQMRIVREIIIEGDPSNIAIAHTLGVSRCTIETQLNRLYKKLDVHSRAGLVIKVMTELWRVREREVHHGGTECSDSNLENEDCSEAGE